MAASPAELIERYEQRWSIEVCLQDAKQITGTGQARNRTQRAVERTVPFGLLCQTLTVTWYAFCGRAEHDVQYRRHHAPWYRQKRNPSYQDMLSSLRRAVIAAQYSPVTPHTPNLYPRNHKPRLQAPIRNRITPKLEGSGSTPERSGSDAPRPLDPPP